MRAAEEGDMMVDFLTRTGGLLRHDVVHLPEMLDLPLEGFPEFVGGREGFPKEQYQQHEDRMIF